MNCNDTRDCFPELLYDEIDEHRRGQVDDHLAHCARCREELTALRRTMRLLDEWPAPVSVEHPAIHRPATTANRWTPWRLVVSGAAAALALVVGATLLVAEVNYRDRRLALAFDLPAWVDAPAPRSMHEFILLLRDAPPAEQATTPAHTQALIKQHADWANRLHRAGKVITGRKLTDDPGRVLLGTAAGIDVVDGARIEPAGELGGFFHIRARDYDEAIRIARTCPSLNLPGESIELRMIDDLTRPQSDHTEEREP